MTLKRYKQYYFTFRDAYLSIYKNREVTNGLPSQRYNLKGPSFPPSPNLFHLKVVMGWNGILVTLVSFFSFSLSLSHPSPFTGCEVKPEVNISMSKFCIKLNVPTSDGMLELSIKCDSVS